MNVIMHICSLYVNTHVWSYVGRYACQCRYVCKYLFMSVLMVLCVSCKCVNSCAKFAIRNACPIGTPVLIQFGDDQKIWTWRSMMIGSTTYGLNQKLTSTNTRNMSIIKFNRQKMKTIAVCSVQ